MKSFKVLFLALVLSLIVSGSVLADGTVTETVTKYLRGDSRYVEVLFTCVGDASDGTIPDTAMSFSAKGWYLYNVEVDPGATAPDAADVLIKNAAGRDLLDGLGTNLIHATATQSLSDSMPFFELITGALTLDVDNQATVSATYTVKLTFIQ